MCPADRCDWPPCQKLTAHDARHQCRTCISTFISSLSCFQFISKCFVCFKLIVVFYSSSLLACFVCVIFSTWRSIDNNTINRVYLSNKFGCSLRKKKNNQMKLNVDSLGLDWVRSRHDETGVLVLHEKGNVIVLAVWTYAGTYVPFIYTYTHVYIGRTE